MKVFRGLNWQIFIHKSSLKFNSLSKLEVKKEILNLSPKKATWKGDIPARILKNSIRACSSELTTPINNCLKRGVFPQWPQISEYNTYIQKERPICILPHLSKKFESIIYKQIDNFMEKKFSFYLSVFSKNHNAQYSLLKIIKNGKKNH